MHSKLREYLGLCDTSPTGLVWLKQASSRALKGTPAFTGKVSAGYYQGGLGGRRWYAHRVVYFLAYGDWPNNIDHINGKRDDNRLENLRSVTRTLNSQNRVDKGCSFHKRLEMWRAVIHYDGRSHSLGYFTTEDAAHAVYLAAKEKHHAGATTRCFGGVTST